MNCALYECMLSPISHHNCIALNECPMSIHRSEVLKIFKALHKARKKTFRDDDEMLLAMRDAINSNFKENKVETDLEKIKNLIQQAVTVEDELRTKIIQAVRTAPGHHVLRIDSEHSVTDPGAVHSKRKKKP